MTSVNVCTRARGFRVGHLELESDRCPRALLPPRGLCSRLPEGPQREESPGPPSGPSAPGSQSDGGGGGAHQSCSPQADSGSRSPGEESRRGPPGDPARRGGCVRSGPVSERRAGAAPPRPRDSTPRPQPGSPRRRAQPATLTPTQHHGRDRAPARLPGTRRPSPPGFPAAPRPREWRDQPCQGSGGDTDPERRARLLGARKGPEDPTVTPASGKSAARGPAPRRPQVLVKSLTRARHSGDAGR